MKKLLTKANANGRMRAAMLLRQMGRLNENTFYVRTAESRKVLHRALAQFPKLSRREQQRFVAVLNEYIGSAMQGGPIQADSFIHRSANQLEGYALRLSTQCLAERRAKAALAAGDRHA